MSALKKFILGNSGEQVHNDVVFDVLYELSNNEYEFLIRPQSKYWRFGIRLSKTENVAFFHPSNRYKEPEFKNYIDIHVGVGEWNNSNWSLSNRFQLAQYNLSPNQDPLLDRKDTYVEKGDVKWTISRVDSRLGISYNAQGCEPFIGDLQIPKEYKFFKVFAWADKIDFHLNGTIRLRENSFEIGEITFRKGDLFNRSVLKDCDVIILPASTSGSVQPSIANAVSQFNIPSPSRMEAGSIEIHDVRGVGRPLQAAWAHSVMAGQGSRLEIIREICQKILSSFHRNGIQNVGLPLLGTGAGNLNVTDVAQVYVEILNSSTRNLKFNVYINSNENYEKVIDFFKSKTLGRERSFGNTDHTFRDKNVEPALGVLDLANELARIIKEMPTDEQGTMIGIFGKWGRGKSYLINKVWERFKNEDSYRRVDFHAWKYQDTPATWAYLYEQFAEEYYKSDKWNRAWRESSKKPWIWLNKFGRALSRIRNSIRVWRKKSWRTFYLNRIRLGDSKLISFGIYLLLSIIWYCVFYIFIPKEQKHEFFVGFGKYVNSTIGIFGLIKAVRLYIAYKKTALNLFNEYNSRFSLSTLLGTQSEIQKELRNLIKAWCKKEGHKRVILFVDDIDRCSEKKIIEIIDSLRVVLDDKDISDKLIVVAAIDEDILQHAIKHKYHFLNGKREQQADEHALVSEYLDKLFIVGIKLGPLSGVEMDDFFIQLTKNDCLDEIADPAVPPNSLTDLVTQNTETNNRVEQAEESNGVVILDDTPKHYSRGNDVTTQMSTKELQILRDCLSEFSNATPRQLRIFYYRYVIAKRILSNQYVKNGGENFWLYPSNCRLMIRLLIEYSKPDQRRLLSDHKIEASKLAVQNTVDLLLEEKVETSHYVELIRVLDTVIAY